MPDNSKAREAQLSLKAAFSGVNELTPEEKAERERLRQQRLATEAASRAPGNAHDRLAMDRED